MNLGKVAAPSGVKLTPVKKPIMSFILGQPEQARRAEKNRRANRIFNAEYFQEIISSSYDDALNLQKNTAAYLALPAPQLISSPTKPQQQTAHTQPNPIFVVEKQPEEFKAPFSQVPTVKKHYFDDPVADDLSDPPT